MLRSETDLFIVDYYCATVFSIMYGVGEGNNLSCKKHDNYKSTMNSFTRKYPLVILSPYKDFKSNKSEGTFAKADSNHQKNVRSNFLISKIRLIFIYVKLL